MNKNYEKKKGRNEEKWIRLSPSPHQKNAKTRNISVKKIIKNEWMKNNEKRKVRKEGRKMDRINPFSSPNDQLINLWWSTCVPTNLASRLWLAAGLHDVTVASWRQHVVTITLVSVFYLWETRRRADRWHPLVASLTIPPASVMPVCCLPHLSRLN